MKEKSCNPNRSIDAIFPWFFSHKNFFFLFLAGETCFWKVLKEMEELFETRKLCIESSQHKHTNTHTAMFRVSARFFSTTRTALQSSCKEGTAMNLNVYKNGKPIVAMKDEEYPEWLWTLLDKEAQMEQLKKDDIFRYNRKIIKKQNVARIKMNNFMQGR